MPEAASGFDPFKTVMSRPEEAVADEFDPFKTSVSRPEGTIAERPRATQVIKTPPPRFQPPLHQPGPLPDSGQVPQPPPRSPAPPPPPIVPPPPPAAPP